VHEFSWDDTGESLTDYYSRNAGMFKGMDRFFGSETIVWLSLAVGAVAGGAAGFLIGRGWEILGTVAAAFLGVVLLGFAGFVVGATVKGRVVRRVLGVEHFTSLE
jgi:hypothetical protein